MKSKLFLWPPEKKNLSWENIVTRKDSKQNRACEICFNSIISDFCVKSQHFVSSSTFRSILRVLNYPEFGGQWKLWKNGVHLSTKVLNGDRKIEKTAIKTSVSIIALFHVRLFPSLVCIVVLWFFQAKSIVKTLTVLVWKQNSGTVKIHQTNGTEIASVEDEKNSPDISWFIQP